jgi:hypothetical protein
MAEYGWRNGAKFKGMILIHQFNKLFRIHSIFSLPLAGKLSRQLDNYKSLSSVALPLTIETVLTFYSPQSKKADFSQILSLRFFLSFVGRKIDFST